MINPMYWYSKALAPRYVPPGTNPTEADAMANFINGGGSDGGDIADVRGQGRDQVKDPSWADFRGDWGKVAAMMSPGMSLARDLITGQDPIQGPAPGGGLGKGGMADDLAAFGGATPSQASIEAEIAAAEAPGQAADPTADLGAGVNSADLGAELSAGNSTGSYAKGGTVKGDKRHGIDDVMIAADGGEEIIRAKRAQELGPKFRREVQKKKLDRKALVAALRG